MIIGTYFDANCRSGVAGRRGVAVGHYSGSVGAGAILLLAVSTVSGQSPLRSNGSPPQVELTLQPAGTVSVVFETELVITARPPTKIGLTTQSVFEDQKGFILAPLLGDAEWGLFDPTGTQSSAMKRPSFARADAPRFHRVARLPDGGFVAFDTEAMSRFTADGTFVDARFMRGFAMAAFAPSNGGLIIPVVEPGRTLSIVHVDDHGEIASRRDVDESAVSRAGRVAFDGRNGLFVFEMRDDERGYRIVQLDTLGMVSAVFNRRPSWYLAPGYRPLKNDSIVTPVTSIQAFRYETGRLWLLFHILRPGQQFGDQARSLADWEQRYTFMLEVVDIDSRTVVFSSGYNRPPFHSVIDGSSRVFSFNQEGSGEIAVAVQRPVIRQHVTRRE